MFQIRNVSKQYNGEFALNNVSFSMGEGLNFIVGASGSGKTTLLKILSGMEWDYEGEVIYCGSSIKNLSNREKSYFYNNIFGFVWQDFNLIEDATVLENVLLPQYLKHPQDRKNAEKILKNLKIHDIEGEKVRNLSGGQKQRVAIARELMKNPLVIIADEPTSALDATTAKTIMDILREISKIRTVIVVTHDTSLINDKDNVFQLDKGELVLIPNHAAIQRRESVKRDKLHQLSLRNAFALTKANIKCKIGRFAISMLSLMVAGILLLTTVSGAINNSGEESFNKLFETYGNNVLDISIVGSFMSAGGANGNDTEKPKADVTQNIGGLYDKYVNDKRVEFATFSQAFTNINVTVDGIKYKIETSNSAPSVNKLTAGSMPSNSKNEVVVPSSFVKKLGLTDKQAVGKRITFDASIYNWDSGKPVLKKVKTDCTIVGVVDTMVVYEYEGKMMEYTVDDSFFFSKVALDDMRNQAQIKGDKINFSIRPKTPSDMIAIKDELNQKGIVPIGRFELVEDIVRLNTQTTEQSGSASAIIGVLAMVMVIAVFLISTVIRKREYAIYKVSGFSNTHLYIINFTEILSAAFSAVILMLILSPLINSSTKALFNVNILNEKMLFTGVLMIIGTALLAYVTTVSVAVTTKIASALKAGER